ncbi:MAG: aminoacyl-tRNA hydrolase [Phycisphaerales bacterium]|nr:aminoacyl-tRNA hydrolase [Phycisphaerales bacterium]
MAKPADQPEGVPDGGLELAPGVRVPESAVRFAFVASSGPGGQNVNKRATKCELRIALGDLPLSPGARARLSGAAGRLLNDMGELIIACDEHRSQGRNRQGCLDRLRTLIIEAKKVPKVRKPTAVPRWAKKARRDDKRRRADIKRKRQGEGDDS